ncbi:MAG: hypothetical protein RLZ22_158 [Verrucomicrobiota bacterium]|jgi:hypothetical protein
MVCKLKRASRRHRILGKLNNPGWLAGYAWRIASITGWGYREIMEDLPFAAGLQILHAEDYAHNRPRIWSRNKAVSEFDSLQLIEDAFQNLNHGNDGLHD